MVVMQQRPLALDDSRPIWHAMLIFLVPLMISNVLQSASATLNSIYLGRLIGVTRWRPVGVLPGRLLHDRVLHRDRDGSSVLIGQAYGARDEARLKAVAGTTLTLAIGSGSSSAAPAGSFCRPLLHLIGTPLDVFDDSLSYARVMFLGLPVLFVYLSYTTFVRGTGDSRTPLLALIVSTVLILVFTPALILGWIGLPRLGVASAAYANILANFIALLYLLFALAAEKNPLALDSSIIRHMKLEPRLLAALIRIGIPTGLQMVMVSLAEIAVISLVNRFGSSATAAYGAVNQMSRTSSFRRSRSGCASIFGAQSIGARRFDRLRKIARAGVSLNWIIGAVLIGIVYAFNDSILRLFITDAGVIATAHELLAITLWSYVLFGTSSVLSGLMRSSGTVLWPTLLSIISIWGVEVPVAYTLAPKPGCAGVWIAYPVRSLAASHSRRSTTTSSGGARSSRCCSRATRSNR